MEVGKQTRLAGGKGKNNSYETRHNAWYPSCNGLTSRPYFHLFPPPSPPWSCLHPSSPFSSLTFLSFFSTHCFPLPPGLLPFFQFSEQRAQNIDSIHISPHWAGCVHWPSKRPEVKGVGCLHVADRVRAKVALSKATTVGPQGFPATQRLGHKLQASQKASTSLWSPSAFIQSYSAHPSSNLASGALPSP